MTHGGYQIARDHTDYPVFIPVNDDDVDNWRKFFEDCGIDIYVEERARRGIYYVLFPFDSVEREWIDGSPVIPLGDAISWMQQFRANFQPTLEIIADEYGNRPVARAAFDEGVVAQ